MKKTRTILNLDIEGTIDKVTLARTIKEVIAMRNIDKNLSIKNIKPVHVIPNKNNLITHRAKSSKKNHKSK